MSAQEYYNQPGPPQGYNGAQLQPPQQGYHTNGNNNLKAQQYAPPSGPPHPQQPQPQYGMKPSAPYAPASNQQTAPPSQDYAESQAPPGYNDTAPFSQANEKTGPRFAPRPRLNDPIFLVLFIASVVGFAVVSGIAIDTFVKYNGLGGGFGSSAVGQTGNSVVLDYHSVYLLVMCCVLGLAVAALWLGLVRAFTKVIIEITLALTVLLNIGTCISALTFSTTTSSSSVRLSRSPADLRTPSVRYWSGAIIFLVIALLSVLFYWTMRKRIPLAKLLLQTTIDITKHHPVVYLIVLLGLLVQTALSVWYAFTCIAIYVKWTPGSVACTASGSSCSSAKVGGLLAYSTFSFYWTRWYYYGPRAANSGLPKRASLKSFIRSTTLSLGSIAFGSLIVTILELLRLILQSVQQYEAGQGDSGVLCGLHRGMIRWFNKYAYIEISLYGKSYIPAAKDTWGLMRDRGIDALINDSLVGTVIMWGAYLNGFLCGLFAFIYLKYTNPSYNANGEYTAPILLFAFLIGINEGFTIGSAIDAGVSTIFVGLGEDPMVLAERSPRLFQMISQTYPKVVQGVPRR
ncbi:Protein pns1 [Saitozyma podzolica]|uniref:Protein PNS1 n=1 Tax=Saitozyma podzolica TaxID=1890683 RepID=A0A427XRT3_9TREE|nr:Protein pns1 [Saitozyma podzolica]